MSISEMSRIWKDSSQKGNHLLLLLAIADNANDDGYAFPGISYLAHKTRMAERTVIRMIDDLTASGELIALRRRTKGNRYMVLSGCSDTVRETRIALISDIINSLTAKKSYITDKVVSELPTTINKPSIETPSGGRQRDLVYEAVYEGLTGAAYVSGQSRQLGLANRIRKDLRQIDATPEAVSQYYAALRAKGLSPTTDSAKVQAGALAIMQGGNGHNKPHIESMDELPEFTPKGADNG